MGKYQVTTDQGTYEVETDDAASSPQQTQPASIASQGLGYMAQHPVMTAMQPLAKTLTGKSVADMAMDATAMPIPQAQQRPFDAGVNMAGSPLHRMADIGSRFSSGGGGGLVDQFTTPANQIGLPLMKGIGKALSPTIYTDKLVTSTAQSAVSKINGAVQPLRDLYSTLSKPFANQTIDSETFQKALSVVPKSARQDFIDDYASKVLDASGKPQTTIGNLHKMELELKDKISQPKYGQTVNAQSYNFADAAKQLKQLRISQLPQEVQDSIKTLDAKFGPVVNMSDFLLPKLSNKAGSINTKTLYSIFSNPADAGTRQYLADLNKMGVDLTPEINIIKGWVARQGAKKLFKGLGGKAVEGAAIATGVHI